MKVLNEKTTSFLMNYISLMKDTFYLKLDSVNMHPSDAFLGIVTGFRRSEEYRLNGKLHRVDGPAFVEYDQATGVAVSVEYLEHGLLHRDPAEGPAAVFRDPVTGVVGCEMYSVRGHHHRDPAQGPAVTERDRKTGRVKNEEYWQNGEQLPPPERPAGNGHSNGPAAPPKIV